MAALTFTSGGALTFGLALRCADGREEVLAPQAGQMLGTQHCVRFASPRLSAEVACSDLPEGGGFRLDFHFTGARDSLDGLDRIILLDADLSGPRFERVFSFRRDVWLPAGSRRADGGALADGPDPRWDADHLMVLYTPGARALLAGVLFPAKHSLELSYRNGRLSVALPLEGLRRAPERLACPALVLLWDRPLLESLEFYGELNRIGALRPWHRSAPVAWNSWDYFQGEVTQAHMREALQTIRSDPRLKDRIQALVLDAGWADRDDWSTPNEKFPDLAGMAQEIAAAGYLPGIWVSPLRVDKDCRWLREHPETALWGESRGLYPVPLTPELPRWVLDYTHPLVQEKIFREFRALYAMGFRYFKTDFLQAANTNLKNARRHNPGVSPVEGLRQILLLIRAAIGEDSFWLACGTETLPVAGLADAARVSDDIVLRFSTLQVCVRNLAAHFWCNGNLWLNDPDFFVARGRDTSASPFLNQPDAAQGVAWGGPEKPFHRASFATGPVFTLEESRTWANLHLVYGGVLAWSDHPGQLNARGLELLEQVLTGHAAGGAGIPLDLEEHNLPQRWLRPCPGGWLLGLFNLEETPQRVALNARDLMRIGPLHRVQDLWTGETLPWDGKQFAVELPAHVSRVFRLERT